MNPIPLFQLKKVSFSVPGKPILKDITLNVFQGDFLIILGPSGAGKSSLLRLFNGLDSPTSGIIYYKEQQLTNYVMPDLRKRIGMVFQTPVIVQGNVRDNLLLIQRWEKPTPTFTDGTLADTLSKVGLDHEMLNQDAKSLSGGEKQRLALARTLLNEPEVLLLDEPTSDLDPNLAHLILKMVHNLYKNLGLTVVMVSHDQKLVSPFAQRVAFLIDGRIVEEGTVRILSNPLSSEAKTFLVGVS